MQYIISVTIYYHALVPINVTISPASVAPPLIASMSIVISASSANALSLIKAAVAAVVLVF